MSSEWMATEVSALCIWENQCHLLRQCRLRCHGQVAAFSKLASLQAKFHPPSGSSFIMSILRAYPSRQSVEVLELFFCFNKSWCDQSAQTSTSLLLHYDELQAASFLNFYRKACLEPAVLALLHLKRFSKIHRTPRYTAL